MQNPLLIAVLVFVALTGQRTAHAQLLDAFRNLFSDPVVRTIDNGLKPGGDLAQELEEMDYVQVSTAKQADAIIRALEALPMVPLENTDAYSSAEWNVTSLMEQVWPTDSDAYFILQQDGIPEVIRIYQTLKAQHAKEPFDEDRLDDVINLLCACSFISTREGTELIIQESKSGFATDSYLWHSVFSNIDFEHPHREWFYESFHNELPTGEACVALLDAANSISFDSETFRHPFSYDAGIVRLAEFLRSSNEDDSGAAYSAAVSLAFLPEPARRQLFPIAITHFDPQVQVEAAWGAATAGDEIGFQKLVEFSMNVHQSTLAMEYLSELDAEDRIPAAALEPDFAAKAEFSQWLQHPNELARIPDELHIVDSRELIWINAAEPTRFTILSYSAEGETPLDAPDTGVGLVGSMTWCFFDDDIQRLPPEDVYAIHYVFEAKSETISEDEFGDDVLATLQGDATGIEVENAFDKVELEAAYTIDADFGHPRPLVGVATAKRYGESGFVVYDGPDSCWYRAEDFPEDFYPSYVLDIHLGRKRLGFGPVTSREIRPPTPEPKLEPEFIVSTYEQMLTEAQAASPRKKSELLGGYEPLDLHFLKYIDAKAKTTDTARDEVLVVAYESVAAIASQAHDADSALSSYSFVGNHLVEYCKAINVIDQPDGRERASEMISRLEPHWTYPFERSQIGVAAYECGMLEDAKRFLTWKPGDDIEMDTDGVIALANILHSEGNLADSKSLMTQAILENRDEMRVEEDPEYRETYMQELNKLTEAFKSHFGKTELTHEP